MSTPGSNGPSPRRTLRSLTIALALSIAMAAVMTLPVVGQSDVPISSPPIPPLVPEERSSLEALYSPVLSFSGGERTFPVAVDHFVAHSRLTGGPAGTGLEHPGLDDLGGPWDAGFYLDHLGGTRSDGGAIVDYERDRDRLGHTIYVRTTERAGAVIIQYWLFYVFNQGGLNSHEGDWEMVQVIVDRGTMAPTSLTLSRHYGGARTPWAELTDEDLEGTHPVILVAAGSHANYLPSDLLRFPGDRADGRGEVLGPTDYRLVPIDREDNMTSPSWLLFPGSWGERTGWSSLLGTGGPPGPMYREDGLMWDGLAWGA